MSATALPVRERIMQHLRARFDDQREGVDDYGRTWEVVTRRPLERKDAKNHHSIIGLYDAKERKQDGIGYSIATLTLMVEFFLRPVLGEGAETEVTVALAEIERQMLSDINCNGLSIDLQAVASEVDLDGSADSMAAGILTFSVVYRHALNNPFKLLGE